MAKIYTYSIIDNNKAMDSCIKGIEGSYLYSILYRDIGIVVSDFRGQAQDINPGHVLAHEEIVERLMENFTVLPMRFLTLFNNEEDILNMMKEYYADFKSNLDRVRNKVEFGIKVIWHGDTIKKRIINVYGKEKATSGIKDDSVAKAFIKGKFKDYKIEGAFEDEADRYIEFIDKAFSIFSSESRLRKLQTENLLLNASYLVDKEKQGEFKQAFNKLRNMRSDFKYLFSGPWPPYNFVILNRKDRYGSK